MKVTEFTRTAFYGLGSRRFKIVVKFHAIEKCNFDFLNRRFGLTAELNYFIVTCT